MNRNTTTNIEGQSIIHEKTCTGKACKHAPEKVFLTIACQTMSSSSARRISEVQAEAPWGTSEVKGSATVGALELDGAVLVRSSGVGEALLLMQTSEGNGIGLLFPP
jgi:hypothetical protein